MLKILSRIYRKKSGAEIYLPPKLLVDSQFPFQGNEVWIEIKGKQLIVTEKLPERREKKE